MEKDCSMEPDHKEISVTGDSLISDIQFKFSGCYPFLKIDFFMAGNKLKNGRSNSIEPHTSLKHMNHFVYQKFDISNNRSVAEVAHDLQEALGVRVEVSRKSGNVWNTISISDSWTLQSQNIAAEFISSQMTPDTKLITD